MANGYKTGGRKPGSKNKPKVSTNVSAVVAAAVATAAGAPPPGPSQETPTRTPARARPAATDAFPKHRIARLDGLVPYVNNARTHSPAQVAKIAASIKEFGFTNPILTDGKRGIVAGHGRVLAAQMLGLETVPVIELSHLSAAQRRAYIIADNRLALDAGWDDELLALELGDLRDGGFDLSLIGFEPGELSTLFGEESAGGLTDPDEVPAVPAVPVSLLGDVWLLGKHRLCCGDSTTVEAVDAALAGVKPHLMVTDPPYGVNYDPEWRAEAGINKNRGKMGLVENDSRSDWSEAWALFPGEVLYVWCAPGPLQCSVHDSLVTAGFEPRQQIIWAKDRFALGRGNYHYQHEPCWYAVRKSKTAHWNGDRSQASVWNIGARDDSGHGHSTQKPVECMKRPIENNSSPGQAVYEPFSGSGTTIIAGEMTGRSVHAIELSPAYVDVAVKRWQAFVGAEATLESTGQTFAATELSRSTPARPARVKARIKVAA